MSNPIATSGIVQTAFDLLEKRPPSSLADTDPDTQLAARNFPKARDSLLKKAPWSFARGLFTLQEVDLAASGLIVDPDLPNGAALDAAILKVWVVGDDRDIRWRIDGRILRTDENLPIVVRATKFVDDETLFPPEFQLAVSYRLAVLCAPRFITSLSKRRELKNEAMDALSEALRSDGHASSEERYDGLDPQPDYVEEALR